MMKVLTVRFDVTNLPDSVVEELKDALSVQGEDLYVEELDEEVEVQFIDSTVTEEPLLKMLRRQGQTD